MRPASTRARTTPAGVANGAGRGRRRRADPAAPKAGRCQARRARRQGRAEAPDRPCADRRRPARWSRDDEGGPGDTPASVAWLRAGRGTGYEGDRERLIAPALIEGRRVDPESGQLEPPPRATDKLGRPSRWDPPRRPHSSVARVEPEPPPQPRGGSTVGLSDWERWLEFCARIDGFPRHLCIHSGGMLVTAAPLIDIAPLERATMPDRVVVQFDKRDVETLKLIKLDLLGLGMLAAMDETLQLIEHDCAVCLDLDRLPEEVPEVFAMLQAADTVGVFQVESRAQMQTLPKSRPQNLDDLVVEVAIIRPGPIQGNAVHPYLRRKQGLEPVTYLHPSLEPVLKDSMGVILYQEQVMRIAIEVAGFSPAESDGFRRAMGTWRSSREMEKLHRQFFEGCLRQPGMTEEVAEELFRQVAAFASFGFAKSHAAAFARTAYESAFLKLFYPAQFLVGLINAQPMGFYPVEVLVNDAKRHGVAVLPVDINASSYKTTTEWVGHPGWVLAGAAGDDGSHDDDPGEPLPEGSAASRPGPGRSARRPASSRRPRPASAGSPRPPPAGASAWDSAWSRGSASSTRRCSIGSWRAGRTGAWPTSSSGPACPRRSWSGSSGPGRWTRSAGRGASCSGSCGRWPARHAVGWTAGLRGSGRTGGRRSTAAGRPMDLRLPATEAPALPEITESERIGDAYAVIGLDARRQVVTLFRPALDRLGAVTNAASPSAGRVRSGSAAWS